MSWIPALIAGLGAVGGGLANRSSASNQSGSSNTNAFQSYANNGQNRNYQVLNPEDQGYLDTIRTKYLGQLNNDPNLSGYAASGVGNINKNAALQGQNTQEMLAARGVTGNSPLALTAGLSNDANRFSQITNFQQSIPLLQHQIQSDDLQKAIAAFSQFPKTSVQDTSSSGVTNGTQSGYNVGNATQPGNILGGSFSSLATILAGLYGNGAFQSQNPTHLNS